MRVRLPATVHKEADLVPVETAFQFVHGQVQRPQASEQGVFVEKIEESTSVQGARTSAEVPQRAIHRQKSSILVETRNYQRTFGMGTSERCINLSIPYLPLL